MSIISIRKFFSIFKKNEKELEENAFFTSIKNGDQIDIRDNDEYEYAIRMAQIKLQYLSTSKEKREIERIIGCIHAYATKDNALLQTNERIPYLDSLDKSRTFAIAIAPSWVVTKIDYNYEKHVWVARFSRKNQVNGNLLNPINGYHRENMEAAILYGALECAIMEKQKSIYEEKTKTGEFY